MSAKDLKVDSIASTVIDKKVIGTIVHDFGAYRRRMYLFLFRCESKWI